MNDEKNINQEKIDGRTKMYRDTVSRLEHNRRLREERKRSMTTKNENIVANAMKMVEMYRKLREEKKKTIMGAKKESVQSEPIKDDKKLTRGQMVDAIGMNSNGKFEVNEEELSSKQKAYRAFFEKALKKFGKKSPAAMDDGEKKKFFDYVKSNWKG
jgi:predicted  nucleic acid-binding Zn-ribbon protein